MRTYEIMCVFAPQEEAFQSGIVEVEDKLSHLEANVESKKDMGVKKLAYPIQKHEHAHYLYFTAKLSPDNAHALRTECKLISSLLRILIIKKS